MIQSLFFICISAIVVTNIGTSVKKLIKSMGREPLYFEKELHRMQKEKEAKKKTILNEPCDGLKRNEISRSIFRKHGRRINKNGK